MNYKNTIWSTAVFYAGFFGLLAQTLLFRDFLAVFQGSEIATGIFFFSWLIWIIAGAFIGYIPPVNRWSVKRFELLIMLYIPAFIAQKYLLFDARQLIGSAEYEIISLWKLGWAVTLFNAPVSIVTGWIFVAGTVRLRELTIPAARVYVLDTAGSFLGASAVTLLLYFGQLEESIFLGALIPLLLIPLFVHFAERHLNLFSKFIITFCTLCCVISIILLASGKGAAWHEYNNLRQWKRMLPGGKFRGSFNTPQAKYLYGDYRGGFDVIRWDSICETLPNRELAIQTAAVNLVQNPTARHILVFGSGALPLCGFLCSLEQIEQVVWMDSDPDYPTEVLKIAPVKFNKKLSVPAQDIRSFLGKTRQEFDLVIMLLPAPSSLSMNRYFSVNSYHLIKSCLAPSGVLSAGFPGGENYMGEELKFLGASLLKTLREVFPYVILKPGDSSRFFASRQKNLLTIKPEELEKRLSTIPQLASQLPPQALYTLYDPFRADFQMEIYQKTLKDSANRLLNSDTTPILSRFTMLYSGKKAGFELPTGLKEISPQTIFQTAAAVILLLTILRSLLYMLMRRRNYLPAGAVSRDMNFPVPDILFFVWITSVLAMAFNIILMFVFQIDKGALFLYFGLLNALFMLGMFIGSRAVEILQTLRVRGPFFLWLSLMTVGYVLLLIVRLPVSQFTCFFFLFFLAGLISGTWLPRAAFVLKQREQQHRSAALKLWLCDSLGGAVGGLLSAILLLPLLGLRLTLILLMCISIVMTALSMIFVFTNNPKGQI